MRPTREWMTVFLVALVLASACGARTPTPTPTPAAAANMPNPASVYCEQQGGQLDLRPDAAGAVAGMCVFPDKSECDEWAYWRGTCRSGDSLRTAAPTAAAGSTATPAANMPNPASVYCEQQGGKLDLRPDATGAVAGICVFPDKSECDEWAYWRGTCQPGNGPAVEVAADGWQVYRNRQLGYRFHYPAAAMLEFADDPLASLTILGPVVDGDNWPMIFVSHPADRPEYRPPAGADLAFWLKEHDLLQTSAAANAEARLADLTIAGTQAIHTRLARSPQTYAYDKYFLARAQQLYMIVILHTGDKEDWAMYNQFLESFQFE